MKFFCRQIRPFLARSTFIKTSRNTFLIQKIGGYQNLVLVTETSSLKLTMMFQTLVNPHSCKLLELQAWYNLLTDFHQKITRRKSMR